LAAGTLGQLSVLSVPGEYCLHGANCRIHTTVGDEGYTRKIGTTQAPIEGPQCLINLPGKL
jgi:hypothetical protein